MELKYKITRRRWLTPEGYEGFCMQAKLISTLTNTNNQSRRQYED